MATITQNHNAYYRAVTCSKMEKKTTTRRKWVYCTIHSTVNERKVFMSELAAVLTHTGTNGDRALCPTGRLPACTPTMTFARRRALAIERIRSASQRAMSVTSLLRSSSSTTTRTTAALCVPTTSSARVRKTSVPVTTQTTTNNLQKAHKRGSSRSPSVVKRPKKRRRTRSRVIAKPSTKPLVVKPFYVYMAESLRGPYITREGKRKMPPGPYVGYTVDISTRIREHNGEITGGANSTHIGRPWRMIASITGDPTWFTKSVALSLEKCLQLSRRWHNKAKQALLHPKKQKRKRKGGVMTASSPPAPPPPPPLPTVKCHGHTVAVNRLNDLFWFFHTHKQWSKRKSETAFTNQSLQFAIHPDFDPASLQATIAPLCQFWNPVFSPLVVVQKPTRKRKQ